MTIDPIKIIIIDGFQSLLHFELKQRSKQTPRIPQDSIDIVISESSEVKRIRRQSSLCEVSDWVDVSED